MTSIDIARTRVRNQRIGEARLRSAHDVVDWLVAVQAQDFAGAKWSLGLRMRRGTEGDVERAFAEGSILRTHVMRPTWHFVTPSDIRWMLTLTAPRVRAASTSMLRRLELDNAVTKKCRALLAKALREGERTRDELRDALERGGIETSDGVRLAYILMSAELDGLICSGVRRGKQFTYALLDQRAPRPRILSRRESLVELASRYFSSRGPATVHDFAKWSGLTVAEASRGLWEIESQFESDTRNGRTYWFSTELGSSRQTSPTAHLVSVYDEYLSSYRDRGAMDDSNSGAALALWGPLCDT
jgi:hypothetical protein